MPKVTSKLQFTLPKAVADKAHVSVGDELECEVVGQVIVLRRPGRGPLPTLAERLASFDASTARMRERWAEWAGAIPADRGWTRDEAYLRPDDDCLGA